MVHKGKKLSRLPRPKYFIAIKAMARFINPFINIGYRKLTPFTITPITTHAYYVDKNSLLLAHRKGKQSGMAYPWMIKQMQKYLIGLKEDLSNFPANNGIIWTGNRDKCNIFVYDSLWDANYKLIRKHFYRPVHICNVGGKPCKGRKSSLKAIGFTRIAVPLKWKNIEPGDVFANDKHTGFVLTKPNKSANLATLVFAKIGITSKLISVTNSGCRFFRLT